METQEAGMTKRSHGTKQTSAKSPKDAQEPFQGAQRHRSRPHRRAHSRRGASEKLLLPSRPRGEIPNAIPQRDDSWPSHCIRNWETPPSSSWGSAPRRSDPKFSCASKQAPRSSTLGCALGHDMRNANWSSTARCSGTTAPLQASCGG